MTGRAQRTFGLAAVMMVPAFMMAATPATATPPGQNGKLVFSCPATPDPNGGTTSAICVMNPDGTGYTRILDGNGDHPAWSPDGTKIAFRSNRNSSQISLDVPAGDIWVMNADGSNPVQLTHTSSDDRPAWSPDGRIAFTSYRDHVDDRSFRSSIYVMNADGSNQHAVTTVDTSTFDDQPAWSPDGRRIAFVRVGLTGFSNSIDGGSQEIFTINDDGTGFGELTFALDAGVTSGVAKNKPSWSPDGTRVAFTETPFDTNLAGHIAGVVNADGSNEHFLTTNSDILPNGPNVDVLDVVWSPDGTVLAATCSYSQPTTTPGSRLCFIDPATGAISAAIVTPGFAFDPDWAPAASAPNPTITDCNDPRLAGGTIPGSIVILDSTTCTVFETGVTAVGGNLNISGDAGVTTINLGSLVTAGGDLTISGDAGVTTINLASFVTAGGDLTISGDAGVTTINLASLVTAGGDLTITGDAGVSTVNLGSVTTIGGNLNVSGNNAATTVNLSTSAAVGGNLTLESAGDAINLGATQAGGSLTIVANGSNTVSGLTGGTTTDVSVLGGTAAMRAVLPNGAFASHVAFTIARVLDPQPESGTAVNGAPALIAPVGAFQFSFAIPTLNADAQIAFRIDLSQLDADTRAAVLAGVGDGSTTIAVKADSAGSSYQAFQTCTGVQTPQTDGCVAVTLIAADGSVVTDPAQAAFVNLAGVAGHFSTWSVVLVKPLPDTTPPAVTIALTAPNAGVPDGQNGWFVTGPVTGTVQAVKTTGRSGITSLTCGSLTLSLSGLGTQSVTGTFGIAGDGVTHLVCMASDGAGNTSTPATLDVKLDRGAPTLAPTVTPSQVALNGAATAAPNATDAVSGLAAASCGTVDTSAPGVHTVTCTATDNAGNVASAVAAYTVIAPIEVCLGEPAHQVLPPIAPDGSSVFVRGLPIPVRFRVCDAAGHSISSKIVSSFRLVGLVSGGVAQTVNLPVRSAIPELGFFWDPLLREWDFLLATDALKAGTIYIYDITLMDGSHIGFRFALKAAR